jgi:hypothetical protein
MPFLGEYGRNRSAFAQFLRIIKATCFALLLTNISVFFAKVLRLSSHAALLNLPSYGLAHHSARKV